MTPWLILIGLLLVLGLASPVLAALAADKRPDHADGSAHDFAESLDAGAHSCGPRYCRHWRKRCECGAERLAGFSAEEVR